MTRMHLVNGCVFFLFLGLSATVAGEDDYSCTNCSVQVSAGRYHSCGLRDDGSVTCWGSGTYAQTTPATNPGRVYLQISAGGYHTCGVFDCLSGYVCTVGNVACWGRDVEEQSSPPINTPYVQIEAGRWHTCAVTTEGTIDCWGDDGSDQSTPPANSNWEFFQVSAGNVHTCALYDCTAGPGEFCPEANIECWGGNFQGQTDHPVNFVYSQVSAGAFHTCAVRENGTVDCWGSDTDDQASPPAGSFVKVAAGGYHTCALTTDGSIVCWGDDSLGQATPPDGTFTDVTAAEYHSCAVRTDGLIQCWGSDDDGRSWPTAGMCGLFRSDFESHSDCRWSNSERVAWVADCDGDGYGSPFGEIDCGIIGITVPRDCPDGSWTHTPPTGIHFDCADRHDDVYSDQTAFFEVGYDRSGAIGMRYDYNCNGVEEYELTALNSGSLCCAWNPTFGSCQVETGKGCGEPGWDAASVSGAPGCGEAADFVTCTGSSELTCGEGSIERVQRCR
jgi:hypothetical protein